MLDNLLFWTTGFSCGFGLTWLAHCLYEWQERRSYRKVMEERHAALFWRVR